MSAAGIARLVHAGLLPERELASVSDRLGIPGGPGPMRVLTATIAGGIEIEILPGRGLDIGRVRRRGEPIAWVSPVADARALDHPQGDAWIGRFIGGLLATCGLRNIGPAEGGEGQHGDYGHLPADRLGWRTESLPDGARITVTGTVASERIFGDSFRVDRAIVLESTSAADVVEVRDEIVNTGVAPARLRACSTTSTSGRRWSCRARRWRSTAARPCCGSPATRSPPGSCCPIRPTG